MNHFLALALSLTFFALNHTYSKNQQLNNTHTASTNPDKTLGSTSDVEDGVLAFFGLTKSSSQVVLNEDDHVVKLYLGDLNISALPNNIGNLIFLEELWLGNNLLTSLVNRIFSPLKTCKES